MTTDLAPPPKLRQPARLRLVDDVVQALEDAILAGRMRPGERLIETWIGQELEVSRTTVREALLKLEGLGLVVSTPRRGTFVTRVSERESADLRATRALLEAFALESSFPSIDAAVLACMERTLTEMGGCTLPGDVPKLVKLDIAFHEAIIAASGAARARDLWASLNGQMAVVFLTALESLHASIEHVVAFHRALLDDLASGDLPLARQSLIAHYVGRPDSRILGGLGTRIATVVGGVTAEQQPSSPAHLPSEGEGSTFNEPR